MSSATGMPSGNARVSSEEVRSTPRCVAASASTAAWRAQKRGSRSGGCSARRKTVARSAPRQSDVPFLMVDQVGGRVQGCLGPRGEAELRPQVRDVPLDCPGPETELDGDLAVREPASEQTED